MQSTACRALISWYSPVICGEGLRLYDAVWYLIWTTVSSNLFLSKYCTLVEFLWMLAVSLAFSSFFFYEPVFSCIGFTNGPFWKRTQPYSNMNELIKPIRFISARCLPNNWLFSSQRSKSLLFWRTLSCQLAGDVQFKRHIFIKVEGENCDGTLISKMKDIIDKRVETRKCRLERDRGYIFGVKLMPFFSSRFRSCSFYSLWHHIQNVAKYSIRNNTRIVHGKKKQCNEIEIPQVVKSTPTARHICRYCAPALSPRILRTATPREAIRRSRE